MYMSLEMQHGYVHAACLYSCCMTMSTLHDHVHAACNFFAACPLLQKLLFFKILILLEAIFYQELF
jgi:hypothetical protein